MGNIGFLSINVKLFFSSGSLPIVRFLCTTEHTESTEEDKSTRLYLREACTDLMNFRRVDSILLFSVGSVGSVGSVVDSTFKLFRTSNKKPNFRFTKNTFRIQCDGYFCY